MAGQDDGCGWLILLAAGAGLYFYLKQPEAQSSATSTPLSLTTENIAAATTPPVSVEPLPPPPKPLHNYDFREGDTYGYEAALSEDDRKKGNAARDVVIYRYVGLIGGKHTLEALSPDGTISSVSQCATNCHAIRTWSGGQSYVRAYDHSSIMGAAMEDAINGRLRKPRPPVFRPAPKEEIAPAPAPDAETPPAL